MLGGFENPISLLAHSIDTSCAHHLQRRETRADAQSRARKQYGRRSFITVLSKESSELGFTCVKQAGISGSVAVSPGKLRCQVLSVFKRLSTIPTRRHAPSVIEPKT